LAVYLEFLTLLQSQKNIYWTEKIPDKFGIELLDSKLR